MDTLSNILPGVGIPVDVEYYVVPGVELQGSYGWIRCPTYYTKHSNISFPTLNLFSFIVFRKYEIYIGIRTDNNKNERFAHYCNPSSWELS